VPRRRDIESELADTSDGNTYSNNTFHEGNPPSDTESPAAPSQLAASAASSSQIDLSWTASTDNVGVEGYKVYRDGVQVGTATTTSYSDTGLSSSTTYTYYVKAYDLAGNLSAESNTTNATTTGAAAGGPVHPSLPDWSKAGYKGGQAIPTGGTIIDLMTKGITANDGVDDSAALQAVIDDIRSGVLKDVNGNPFGESNRAILKLPAGQVDLNKQIRVDANGITLRGAGKDPATGTKIVFAPPSTYTSDAGLPVIDGKIWPGYGAFRVETREKHPNEPNYEGSINFHWKSGVQVASTGGGTQGSDQVYLASGTGSNFSVGDTIYVGAANTVEFYEMMQAPSTYWVNQHMRSQMFKVTAVNGDTLTIDKPLEFDIPYSNNGQIGGTTYYSKVMPITIVSGVGFEDFYFTQTLDHTEYSTKNANDYDPNTNPDGVGLKYTNGAPEYALHGIVFKWAKDSWVKGVQTYMTGSHPIVTEFAKNIEITDNIVYGAWNKGKGGHGYVRGSKLWDSKIVNNTIDRIRHVTLQWSASGNVIAGNTISVDLNLHGGWERRNLIERNTVNVPFEHSSWGEGEGGADILEGTWYPIWYGAGPHASKWSGATGYQNVYFNNVMKKQETEDGAYVAYAPYDRSNTIYQIGWDGSAWAHLEKPTGTFISTWGGNEKVDFSTSENHGVYTCLQYTGTTLLENGTATDSCSGDTQAPSTPTNLTAKAASATQIDLSWTASTDNVDVAGYKVFRDGIEIATTSSPSYSDSGLAVSTTYSYTVKAYDTAGNTSAASNTASAATNSDTTTKATPVTLIASEDSFVRGGIYKNDNYGSLDHMMVKLHSTNSDYDRKSYVKFDLAALDGAVDRAIVKVYVGNIHSNTTSYTIETRGIADDSWSESTITYANQPSESGTSLGTARVDTEGVYVSFDVSSYVSKQTDSRVSFRIHGIDDDAGADYRTKEYSDSLTHPILVINGGSSTTSDTEAPTAPASVTATAASSSQIDLSWTASTDNVGVAGYKVFRDGVEIASTTATNYSDTGLRPSTTYSYVVKSYDAAGNVSAASPAASAATNADADTTAPSAPTGLTATAASTSQIDVSWTASTDNTGVSGYEIYRDTVKIATTTSTSYSDSGLQAGTTYSYYIIASDAAGNKSTESNTASATTQSSTNTSGVVSFTGTVLKNSSTYKEYQVAVNTGTYTATKMSFKMIVNKQGDEYWYNQWTSGSGDFKFAKSETSTQIIYQYDLKTGVTESGTWSFNGSYKLSTSTAANTADDTWEVIYTTSDGKNYTISGTFDGSTVK
jgi:chitodextrinase